LPGSTVAPQAAVVGDVDRLHALISLAARGHERAVSPPPSTTHAGSVEGRFMWLAPLALTLLAACVIGQSLGVLVLIPWLARVRPVLESPSILAAPELLLRLFVTIVLLHLIQVGRWAVVFWRAREVSTLETVAYFSLVTYSTIGFGDIVL